MRFLSYWDTSSVTEPISVWGQKPPPPCPPPAPLYRAGSTATHERRTPPPPRPCHGSDKGTKSGMCRLSPSGDRRYFTRARFHAHMSGGPISFRAKTQALNVQSTVEGAELMMISSGGKGEIYQNNFMIEQGFKYWFVGYCNTACRSKRVCVPTGTSSIRGYTQQQRTSSMPYVQQIEMPACSEPIGVRSRSRLHDIKVSKDQKRRK